VALKKLLLILLLVLILPAAYAFVCSGCSVRVAAVNGQLATAATGEGCRMAWIEQDGAEARLMVVRRSDNLPEVVYQAPALSGLAVAGGGAFVTESAADSVRSPATLLRVDLVSGEVRQLAVLPQAAVQVVVGESYLCWREHRASPLPGVNFVSAGAPVEVIGAQPLSGGETARVAVVQGSAGNGEESAGLVGVGEDCVYWVARREEGGKVETEILRATLPGGEPVTLGREAGSRAAVLSGNAILWTAPSVEAAAATSFSSVKRLGAGESRATVIADWLGPKGSLHAHRGSVYVAERSWLWRLGKARGEQRAISRWLPGGVITSHIADHSEYAFVRTATGIQLVSRPLSWRGRLSRIVGW
jgi:hypothetical protein